MHTAERRAVAALWSLPGVGRKTLERLRARVDLASLLPSAGADLARANPVFSAQARRGLAQLPSLGAAADTLERRLAQLGHRVVFSGDAGYPARLTEVGDAPPLLFVLGPAASAPRRRAAMVGTRHPDAGFSHQVRPFIEAVARAGIGVVSGGAEGVDQLCHAAALGVGGETWAFLGCAIEQVDPPQRRLMGPFREGGGTFFSEFPPGTRPDRSTFPRRNRLISGAADAVLVLRAPQGSGALHTARYALEHGRPLLAMPGDPFNTAAAGCNALLHDGAARVCLAPADVLAALGEDAAALRPPPVGDAAGPVSASAGRVLSVLQRAPIDFDALQAKTELTAGALLAALLELELSGHVIQRAGRRFERR
ncbi:MAG: DNA-protecting protein DprA [Archangium sp.]|nr:DNA-protecting protein DprA [Archangium sp.]